MTEEEAKTHDCIGPENCGQWIGPIPDGGRRVCIGSACGMGWRWVWRTYRDPYGSIRTGPDGRPLQTFTEQKDGYCGLAGEP